ncbi:MAG: carboxypeptidase regulatory-like domain-containing protein [Fidelibacterota bacterium]
MKAVRTFAPFFPASLFLVGILSAGEIHGTVTARIVKYQKDAVVYVDKIEGAVFDPPDESIVMDQHNLAFIPRVLPILVGSRVDFLNSDDVLHNVFSPDKVADRFNLGTYPRNERRSKLFNKPGEAVVLCNVHPEMEAYVVVLETPYFAVTDEKGNYLIENVPEGTYTLKVWSEKYGSVPQGVNVPHEGAAKVIFRLEK